MVKRYFWKVWSIAIIYSLAGGLSGAMAQEPLTLDSCRNMALRNNKSLSIADE